MLADDDVETRQVVRQILESAGLEVHEASSGVTLLALADDGDFDLVVTDIRMPWISGEHVMQMARAAGFEMPVLIMTAYADEWLQRSVAAIPGATLLEKPFEIHELVARARGILGIPGPAE